MLGMNNNFHICGSIEKREVDIAGVAFSNFFQFPNLSDFTVTRVS